MILEVTRSTCQIAGPWCVMSAIAWSQSLLGHDCKDGIKRSFGGGLEAHYKVGHYDRYKWGEMT